MKAARLPLVIALTCWCTTSSAQDPQPRAGAEQVRDRPSGDQRVAHQWLPSSPAEKQIAALIYGLGHNEIEIAKFAHERSETEMARQFAEKMIREHTPGCQTMKQIAGDLVAHMGGEDHSQANDLARNRTKTAAANPGQPRSKIAPPAPQDPSPATDSPARAAAAGSPDWLSIHQQIAALRLDGTKRELAAQPGTHFDKGFMVQQVLAHQRMIDTLQALRSQATAELRRHIDSELQLASAHLQQARQIEQQLEGQDAVRTTRRP